MSSEFNPDDIDIEEQLAKSIEQIVNDEEERAYGYEVKSKEPREESQSLNSNNTTKNMNSNNSGTNANNVPYNGCDNEDELRRNAKENSKEQSLKDELYRNPGDAEYNGGKRSTNNSIKKKNNKPIIIASVIVAVAIVIIIAVLVIDNKKKDTYTYQYNKGVESLDKKLYKEAASYFKKAMEYDEAKNKAEVRIDLAKAYEGNKKYGDGINVLYTVLSFDEYNEEAISGICNLLKESKDIDGLNEFIDKYTGTDGEKGLAGYMVSTPKASEDSGDYTKEIEIELASDDNTVIYYTTDGSEPDEKSEKYKEPIELGKGEHQVKAMAINADGIKSATASYSYGIKINKPAAPAVTPKNGNYTEVQKIIVSVPDGSKAYYTLDGTTPNTESSEYKEPIDMPEGNTVFSVVIVDKYEQMSNVTRMNYTLAVKSKYGFDDAVNVLKGRLKELGVMSSDRKDSDGNAMSLVYYSKKTIDNREIYLISVDITKDGQTERKEYWYGVDANNCETFTVTGDSEGNYSISPL